MVTPTTAGIALVIALIVFGPGRLPELGKALGRGLRDLKDALGDERTGAADPRERDK